MASSIDPIKILLTVSPKDLTDLEKACRLGNNASRVSELILANGRTLPSGRALFFAAGSGDPLVLNLILAAGAPVSLEPRFNPLNAACCARQNVVTLVELLLQERPECKPDQQTLVLACTSKIQTVAERILILRPPYSLQTIVESLLEAIAAGFHLSFLEKICAYFHTKPGKEAPKDPITCEVEAQLKRKKVDVLLIERLISRGWRPQPSTVTCLLNCLRGVPLDQARLQPFQLLIEKGGARVIPAEAKAFLEQAVFSRGDMAATQQYHKLMLEELLSKKHFIR